MKPYIAALEHCIGLLRQCKEAEVSLCISNVQMAQMKTRSVHNRVRYNLTHQLANTLASVTEIHQEAIDGDDTQFTLRTVAIKASTYVDLLQGLNVLRAAALEQAYDEPVPEIDDRQYNMFPEV